MSLNDEVVERRLIEGSKLMLETMKHLTTLSIGSILIMVGLLEKVFKAPLADADDHDYAEGVE